MAFMGKNARPEKRTGLTFEGKEIILTKTRGEKPKGLALHASRRCLPTEARLKESATVFAATGSIEATAQITGLPIEHLRKWKRMDEFKAIVAQVREENNDKLDQKVTEIIAKAAELQLDRLENGDVVVDKFGKEHRKPVAARDLALIMAINVDKRQLLRGEPTSRSESTGTVNQLELLAQKFAEFAPKRRPSVEMTDAEIVEINQEERETKAG